MAAKLPSNTRKRILESALLQFSERGFYGTSIANIVKELGLTKQALLHYFPTKEKLYGEVLHGISQGFAELGNPASGSVSKPSASEEEPKSDKGPEQVVVDYIMALHSYCLANGPQTALLMRELLDNRPRAENVGTWYLSEFLHSIIAMVKNVTGWEKASDMQALALAYTWLGTINYHVTSRPTLIGIFGEAEVDAFSRGFPAQLERTIRAGLAAGEPGTRP